MNDHDSLCYLSTSPTGLCICLRLREARAEEREGLRITDWRKVAVQLAWSQAGQPHTPAEQAALDKYDQAVEAERVAALRAGNA